MIPIDFLQRAGPALGFGFLLAFSSSLGQTYFISLFAGTIREELALSHAGFGSLYMMATTASALALVWVGKLADRVDPVRLGIFSMAALAGSALLMAAADSMFWLVGALFCLRFAGQGMLSHVSVTSIGRWFARERGRALGIATLGFPVAEAILPIVVALSLALFSWREIWAGAAGCVILVLAPLVFWLGRQASQRTFEDAVSDASSDSVCGDSSWTRSQVLRDGRFYFMLPGLLAPAFIITGVLFHQVHLIEVKGWTLASFAACYPLYAGSATAIALGLGWLVDRYGTPQILPFYLLPIALGLVLISVSDSIVVAAVFMLFMGASAGGTTIILGSLWAELYGTTHLGSIRALVMALLVLSTAVAPSAMGWLIDAGVSLDAQFRGMAAYLSGCALTFTLVLPSLSRRRPPPLLVPH